MSRWPVIGLALVAVVAGFAGFAAGAPWETKNKPSPSVAGHSAPTAKTNTVDRTLSIVAIAKGDSVQIHTSSGGPSAGVLPNPIPSGAPLTFLVQEQHGEWLRVLLPLRPNGSDGWIRREEVDLRSHHYRIRVELGRHVLTVTRSNAVILSTPVGVGTADTPTPGGLYFTKELLQPPDPTGVYGVYAYGLSGFSNVLTSFDGADGVIGIHGTNDPSSLGKDVSHGCLRISNEAITKLAAELPLGVPVEIVP